MTLHSMTGFGASSVQLDAGDGVTRVFRIEMRSVNHRFLDIRVRAGRDLAALEQAVTARLRDRLERGHIDVYIDPEPGAVTTQVVVNASLARQLAERLRLLADEAGIAAALQVSDLTRFEGVVSTVPLQLDVAAHEAAILAGVDSALDALIAMRATEGQRLADDLQQRVERLRALLSEIAAAAPEAVQERRVRLRERLDVLLAEDNRVDPARLEQEVALLADKSDVSEEITRIDSHLREVTAEIERRPAGRGKKLEFLAQELLREFNTIGSKVGFAAITGAVIDAKCELEKVREQVANLE